jgi:hypothetical protein
MITFKHCWAASSSSFLILCKLSAGLFVLARWLDLL